MEESDQVFEAICAIGFIGFVLYSFVVALVIPSIQAARDREVAKKVGLRSAGWHGYVPDHKARGDGTLDRQYYLNGYIWHDKWKKWVPNIENRLNSLYWERKGYTWREDRRRWVRRKN